MYDEMVTQHPTESNEEPLSIAFLIEALIAAEHLWASLPDPTPLLVREVVFALSEVEHDSA
jgi:hypothetical protein